MTALALNGCQVEGSSRGLVVKFAEDQHKKKELSRLHNLTLTAAFRGVSATMPSPLNMNNMNISQPRGMPALDDNLGSYYYQQGNQHNGGGMYSRGGQGQLNNMQQTGLGQLYIQSPSSPYGGGARKGGLGESPNFGQQMPTSPNSWYPPLNITSPHLSYMQSTNNMMHLGGHPTSSLDFDFSSLGQQNLQMMGAMGGIPPPPTSPHMSQGLAQFGGLGGSNLGSFTGGTQLGMQQQQQQQQQPLQQQQQQQQQGKPAIQLPLQSHGETPVTMILNNVPNSVNGRVLHSLVAPYGQVLEIQLEDLTPTSASSNGGFSGNGLLRARVTWANGAQAEEAARNLEGMVVFEGMPPLQVCYYMSLHCILFCLFLHSCLGL